MAGMRTEPEHSRGAWIAAIGSLAASVGTAVAAIVVTKPSRVARELFGGLPSSPRWPVYLTMIAAGLVLFVVGCVAARSRNARISLGAGLVSSLLTFSVWAHATKLFVPRPAVPADLSPMGQPCTETCPSGYLCFGPWHSALCAIPCGPDGVRACPQRTHCSEKEICEPDGAPYLPSRPEK